MEREFYKNLKQQLIILSALALLISCNKEVAKLNDCVMPGEVTQVEAQAEAEDQNSESDNAPTVCVLPEQELDANLTINFELTNFPVEREKKMRESIERLMLVVNSKGFKQRVLDHEYKGEKTFVDNNGLTNEQIYEQIMEGAETLSPEVDEEIDLNITLYYKNNSTVGYTYPNRDRIWVNDKFFATNRYGKVAANLLHEWTHKIGFGHDRSRTASRPYSVPYGVGTIIKELIDEMTPSEQ